MYSNRQSGSQIINIKAVLQLLETAFIEFADEIEVSLDCFICTARRRTVMISENEEYGICIKTNHQFPIKLNLKQSKIDSSRAEVIYQIEYWYSPFFDRKHNQESEFSPTWGRISFTTTCSKCLCKKDCSLQTNIVRPWTNYCECGASLYVEKDVMPIFEKLAT